MAVAGGVLKQVRKAAGLTVRQVAAAAGMNPATYFRYENRYAKDHLPSELIDRLEPIFAAFGVDRRYLRALEKDGAGAHSTVVTLPPLRPLPLSPFEKAVVRRRVASWQQERDFEARARLIDQFEVPIRAIVDRLTRDRTEMVPTEDLVQEGTIALMDAMESFSEEAGVPFEAYLEERVTDRVKRYMTDMSGALKIPRASDSLIKLIDQIGADEESGPAELGERPIPVYSLFDHADHVGLLDFRSAIEWRRRPPALTGKHYLYAVYVTQCMAAEGHAAGDLLILDPFKSPVLNTDTGLALSFDPEDTKALSFLCRVNGIDVSYFDLTPLRSSSPPLSIPRGRTAVHRALKIQDLV